MVLAIMMKVIITMIANMMMIIPVKWRIVVSSAELLVDTTSARNVHLKDQIGMINDYD